MNVLISHLQTRFMLLFQLSSLYWKYLSVVNKQCKMLDIKVIGKLENIINK